VKYQRTINQKCILKPITILIIYAFNRSNDKKVS